MIPIEELEVIVQWLQQNREGIRNKLQDSYWAGYEEGLITTQVYLNYLIRKFTEK